MRDEQVAGVLLAAGGSTRFGSDKLTTNWDGRSLLYRSTTAMVDGGLEPVVAVVRPGYGETLPEGVMSVHNYRWSTGISASIQTGIAALAEGPLAGAAVFAPADQPWCGAPVYRRLLNAFSESRRCVIVAAFNGAARNPVLLARSRWQLADQLHGDQGLSAVVRELSPLLVECADIGCTHDVDTPTDLIDRHH
jgi:CTP:molybdopterin cytidylyltransferase MocA